MEENNDLVAVLGGTSGANRTQMGSKDAFIANGSTVYGVFKITDMYRSLSVNSGTGRFYAGFCASLPNGQGPIQGQTDGLWILLHGRYDYSGVNTWSTGDGGLIYNSGGTITALATWTWDSSAFTFDTASGFRSDRVAMDMVAPDLTCVLSSDALGYSLTITSSDGKVILPEPVSGTWADAGITNNLSTAYASVWTQGANGSTEQALVLDLIVVNEAETPAQYASEVQRFSTPDFGTVDDFEFYAGNEGQEIFLTWLDGFGGDAALGGSTTGHIDGPFVETSNTNPGTGSSKSMPIYVANDGGFFDIDGKSSSPTFSEVVRDFDPAQDWTVSGIKTLSIMFSGSAGLTGQLYCKINGTKHLYDGDTSNLSATAWQAWNIDLSTVESNLTNVRELAIGVDGGSSGILYIDDIRLYTQMGETMTPVVPDNSDPSLVAHYEFEGNANDTKGSYHGSAAGEPGYTTGKIGQAMTFDGIDDQVVHAFAQEEVWPAYSVGLWVKTDAFLQVVNNSPFNNNSSSSDFQFDVDGSDPGRYRYVGSATVILGSVVDRWVHLAASCDGTSTGVYFNGLLIDTVDIADTAFGQIAIGINRGMAKRFIGTIDDVRVYDRALSAAEIAGLAGRTGVIHKRL